jgi:predicted TPR repeat methyltransferase
VDNFAGLSASPSPETELAALANAEPELKALLAAGVAPGPALLRRGMQLMRENRLPEALARFRSATILAPANPTVWTNYGVTLDRSGALPEAAAALEHSLALSPQQPDTWLLLGLTRAKQGQGEAAEAAYRTVMEQQPESALVWQCFGLLREGQKRFPEAIDCFQAAIQRGGPTAALCGNLGKLLHQLGRIPESCLAYADAVALDPTNFRYRELLRKVTFLQDVLGGASVEAATAAFRAAFEEGKAPDDKEIAELYHFAFGFFSGFNQPEAAARVGKRHLELWPDNQSMAYLLRAVGGDAALARSPAAYITEHFDAFAAGFDEQLVGVLGYDLPEKIVEAVRTVAAPAHLYDVIDAGCGTGLCGPLLRPWARTLVGVDLSAKMLEQAARRDIYDSLVCEDLITFLLRSAGRFDLMLAADVFIYLGDLAEPFAAAAQALCPGGLLAFSTERLAEGTFQLQPSGRFGHSPDYVRQQASESFAELACLETTIRLERTARVPGQIFVLRRR